MSTSTEPEKTEATEASETVNAEIQPEIRDAEAPEGEKPAGKGRSRFMPLVLLLVLGGLVGLYASGQLDSLITLQKPTAGKPAAAPLPSPGGESVTAPTPEATSQAESDVAEEPVMEGSPQAPPVDLPADTSESRQTSTEPAAPEMTDQSAGEPTPSVQAPPPAATPNASSYVSRQEVKQLFDAISDLRNHLVDLQSRRDSMLSALKQQQRSNLDMRLRWITDPSSHLSQMQMAWEEIALLPGLSETEKQAAKSMYELAARDSQSIRQWQTELQQLADVMLVPESENIIPKPSHPWLAWIAGQFSLRPAPSDRAIRLNALRQQLLKANRQLGMEEWPTKEEWQDMRDELALQMEIMSINGHSPVKLPDNFDSITGDILKIRETARQWLKEAS